MDFVASFTTAGTTSLAAGTIILVEGASPQCLNGLYEVQDGSTTTLELRGIGANALDPSNTFTGNREPQEDSAVPPLTSLTVTFRLGL